MSVCNDFVILQRDNDMLNKIINNEIRDIFDNICLDCVVLIGLENDSLKQQILHAFNSLFPNDRQHDWNDIEKIMLWIECARKDDSGIGYCLHCHQTLLPEEFWTENTQARRQIREDLALRNTQRIELAENQRIARLNDQMLLVANPYLNAQLQMNDMLEHIGEEAFRSFLWGIPVEIPPPVSMEVEIHNPIEVIDISHDEIDLTKDN